MTLFSKLGFCPPIDQPRLEAPGAGIPRHCGQIVLVCCCHRTKSTVGLKQRVKCLPLEQFVSELPVVAADVIRHTPADNCRSIRQRGISVADRCRKNFFIQSIQNAYHTFMCPNQFETLNYLCLLI